MNDSKNPRPSGGGRGEAAHERSTSRAGGSRRDVEAQPVGARRERYLVAPLPAGLIPQGVSPFGFPVAPQAPIDPTRFLDQLAADPDVAVARVIPSSGGESRVGTFGAGPVAPGLEFPSIAVVEMPADRASAFAAEPTVHIEPDRPLRYGADGAEVRVADPGLVPFGTAVRVEVVVRGSGGEPVPDAEVYLMSPSFPARAITGRDGRAVLDTSATAVADASAVYVKPAGDYWTVWLASPQLTTDAPNLVTCRSLSETFPGFPDKELEGWGWRAMRFDALPPTFRGHGVKVAIIDSGAAVTHPDIAGRVTAGRDIPDQNDTGWQVDTVGHGTHCAGIIGGKGNGSGILGIVSEAEIHSCKIFPGGRFSDLIEALDYCIRNQLDVVNLSLGSPTPSELVRLKIEQARQAGIACVVAAGNTADAVSFPASMTSVLAVAAIGKLGEYPPDSYHATQTSGIPTADGYFSAKFTCFGPEIDVCAPGVAVVSSVPPDLYAAEDGTSFAGPHVTALAALVLAHHPDFRQQFAHRGPQRVDRLFDIIRASCRPMTFGDPGRSGAGLPDAPTALAEALLPGAAGAASGMPVPGFAVPGGGLGPPSGAMAGGAGPVPAPWGAYPYPQAWFYTQPPRYPQWGYQAPPWPAPQWTSSPIGTPQTRPMGVGPAGAAPQPGGAAMATAPPRRLGAPEATDPLEPLRAAMRAAGLLPPGSVN